MRNLFILKCKKPFEICPTPPPGCPTTRLRGLLTTVVYSSVFESIPKSEDIPNWQPIPFQIKLQVGLAKVMKGYHQKRTTPVDQCALRQDIDVVLCAIAEVEQSGTQIRKVLTCAWHKVEVPVRVTLCEQFHCAEYWGIKRGYRCRYSCSFKRDLNTLK